NRIRPVARRKGRMTGRPAGDALARMGRQPFMNRRTETLARISLFQSLDARAIADLDTHCSWRRVAMGQWLIDYQDASNDVFFVVSGSVRVMIQSAGREVLLRQI